MDNNVITLFMKITFDQEGNSIRTLLEIMEITVTIG